MKRVDRIIQKMVQLGLEEVTVGHMTYRLQLGLKRLPGVHRPVPAQVVGVYTPIERNVLGYLRERDKNEIGAINAALVDLQIEQWFNNLVMAFRRVDRWLEDVLC